MKVIIFNSTEGSASVLKPVEGSRLARWVRAPLNRVMFYSGGRLFVIAREDGGYIEDKDIPARAQTADATAADLFLRGWPIEGAEASWAETEDEWIERIRDKDVPAGATDIRIVDESELPVDRTFRDAWIVGASGVEHHMPTCIDLHKNHLRHQRASRLGAADVEMFRALESMIPQLKNLGIDTTQLEAVAAKKQALRDVTTDPALARAATPEALKAVVPEALL